MLCMPIQCSGTFDTRSSFDELRDCHVKTRQAFDDLMSGFSDSDQVSWRHSSFKKFHARIGVQMQPPKPTQSWQVYLNS